MQSLLHDLAMSGVLGLAAAVDSGPSAVATIVVVLLMALFAFALFRLLRSGLHQVPEGDVAVVERLGRFARLDGPGPVWVTPYFEQIKQFVHVRLREEQFMVRNLWFRDVVQVDVQFTICYWLDLWRVEPTLLRDIVYRSPDQWRVSIENRAARILRDLISRCELMDLIGQDPLFRDELEQAFVRRLEQLLGEWGVRLDRLGGAWLRDIRLTADLQRALNNIRRTDVDLKAKGATLDMIRKRYPGLSDVVLLSLFKAVGGEATDSIYLLPQIFAEAPSSQTAQQDIDRGGADEEGGSHWIEPTSGDSWRSLRLPPTTELQESEREWPDEAEE
jgi:hypothetical protein